MPLSPSPSPSSTPRAVPVPLPDAPGPGPIQFASPRSPALAASPALMGPASWGRSPNANGGAQSWKSGGAGSWRERAKLGAVREARRAYG